MSTFQCQQTMFYNTISTVSLSMIIAAHFKAGFQLLLQLHTYNHTCNHTYGLNTNLMPIYVALNTNEVSFLKKAALVYEESLSIISLA